MSDQLQQRNDAFRAFLETLNDAQRAAVDHLEGPVLVIAGPGTGKTHLLTARIGNILLNSDARAQNILCLTFTDAGVHAMRKKLLERIGPEAHRTPIFTFHSFCNRVIQDNLEYFGQGNLEPLSDLERIEIIRDLLSELPVTHPLRAGKKDLFIYESQVRDLMSNMKKGGWTPGHVLKKTDEFLKNLPEHPDYRYQKNSKYGRKGDPKIAQIQEMTEKLERLKSAADLFPKYQRALEQHGRYEYEDMLLWVNRAFENHEALLRNYQERYQYILVDEFQDTNGAQFKLLNHLLDYWETPNIFIVGDDDQSIYEFQGARLENLLHFARQYGNGLEVIVLEENYRSTQPILDAAARVVEYNQLRSIDQLDKPLVKTLRAHTQELSTPVLNRYDSRLHELADVVQQIQTLIQKGTPAAEIAVLFTRHKQAAALQNLLIKKGITFQSKRPLNVLEVPAIQYFRELLCYLRDELQQPFSGEHRLFRILHAGFFGLNPLDLALVAAQSLPKTEQAENQSAKYAVGEDFVLPNQPFSWRSTLNNEKRLLAINPEATPQLLAVGQKLNQWIQDAANLPLPQLLEHLYAQSGLLDWALQQPDRVWYLQVLQSFQEAVPQPRFKRHWTDLNYFLQVLDNMDDNRLALPLKQTVETTPGVQLLTAHAAKGLEFEHVFVFDCVADAWESSAGDRRGRFTMPPTLTLSGEEDALEARRRLFYVALTRAKRGLYVSFAAQGADGKALTQSRFVDETNLPIQQVPVAAELVFETQRMLLVESPQPQILLPESAVVDRLLEEFTLSITALNRYLRCPLAFWYEDLLKVPGAMSEAAAFGIAMHSTLQRFFLKMKNDKQTQWPSAEALGRIFGQEMDGLRHFFSAHSFAQRSALGKENLRRIHVEQVPFWRKRAIVERRIAQVEMQGIPMAGVLDKIEWLDSGKLRIVDYKTGAPDGKKTAEPNEQQPYGGDYWRQLAFYQILLENAKIYPERVEKTAIAWLEADKRGAFPITEISFSKPDIEFVENLIRETYSKIQHREFQTGCGKSDCAWCKMHLDRRLDSELLRDQEDGLDD